MKVYVKNKLMSLKGSSSVYDENNQDIYKVKGKFFSITSKKKILDMDNNVLYFVRNKFFHFLTHSSFILDANKHKIAKVKNRLFKTGFDLIGYEDTISLDGYSISGYSIIKNGEKVGTVRSPMLTLTDTYEVEVDNQEDVPFMVALIIAIDNVIDNTRK